MNMPLNWICDKIAATKEKEEEEKEAKNMCNEIFNWFANRASVGDIDDLFIL